MFGSIGYPSSDLQIEGVGADRIAAQYGTPLYVYSQANIRASLALIRGAFRRKVKICYPVKANGLLPILRLLADQGCGFDVVSGGELRRLRTAGLEEAEVVFAGVWQGGVGDRRGPWPATGCSPCMWSPWESWT